MVVTCSLKYNFPEACLPGDFLYFLDRISVRQVRGIVRCYVSIADHPRDKNLPVIIGIICRLEWQRNKINPISEGLENASPGEHWFGKITKLAPNTGWSSSGQQVVQVQS